MQSRRRYSFWTMLATVAGVVGAGAAVYPLLQAGPEAAHLTFFGDDSPPYGVWVVTLSDTVVLTGRWYISRGAWWWSQTLRDGKAVGVTVGGLSAPRLAPLKDVRVRVNERALVDIEERDIEEWLGRTFSVCSAGELEMGIEYKWKGGTAWARTTLPFCVSKASS